jgi:hypothetical protein
MLQYHLTYAQKALLRSCLLQGLCTCIPHNILSCQHIKNTKKRDKLIEDIIFELLYKCDKLVSVIEHRPNPTDTKVNATGILEIIGRCNSFGGNPANYGA